MLGVDDLCELLPPDHLLVDPHVDLGIEHGQPGRVVAHQAGDCAAPVAGTNDADPLGHPDDLRRGDCATLGSNWRL